MNEQTNEKKELKERSKSTRALLTLWVFEGNERCPMKKVKLKLLCLPSSRSLLALKEHVQHISITLWGQSSDLDLARKIVLDLCG